MENQADVRSIAGKSNKDKVLEKKEAIEDDIKDEMTRYQLVLLRAKVTALVKEADADLKNMYLDS